MAAAESLAEKNEYLRRGGFSPSQLVLGKSPRGVGHLLDDEEIGHLGVIEGMLDGETTFALRAQYRLTARKRVCQAGLQPPCRQDIVTESSTYTWHLPSRRYGVLPW